MFGKQKLTEAQFTDRWEASKEKFYRFAYCYVKNEADALEILSEATYLAYASRQKLEQPAYFDTWMCRIIMNEAYRYLKKKNRFVPSTDTMEDYLEAEPKVQRNDYEVIEAKMDVYQLLEQVSAEEKTILILKYFEERSFSEISQIIRLPENTVKSKLYRTLDKLRAYSTKEEQR